MLLAATCALAATLGPGPAAGAPVTQPNVVLIVTDDQAVSDLYERTRRGKKGEPVMPETLSLIRDRGVTFTRAYSSNPLSCPSRTTILTGQYAFNHHILANRWPGGGFCSDPGRIDLTRSLPVWLQSAGYRTLHYGRFLNGFGTEDPQLVPPGWDEYVTPVDTVESPAGLYFGYHLNENGVVSSQYGPVSGRDPDNYFTDVIGSKAIIELQTSAPLTQPFFLEIDHRAPHEDLDGPIGPEPAPRHAASMRMKLPPHPPSFNEPNVHDKSPFIRLSSRLTRGQIDAIRRRNARRLRSLRSVDDQLGYLFEALQALGELDETYFIFMADNGFVRGEHRIPKGKRLPYEPSSRIPMLIRGPGIPAGQSSGELVSNADIAPTILELTGATPTRTQDGRSLLPFAHAPDVRTARPVLLEGYFGRFVYREDDDPPAKAFPTPTSTAWKSIVIGRWKLVRYSKDLLELYDLRNDPFELHSLARKRRYEPVVTYLSRRLRELAKCSGASCRAEIKAPKLPRKRRRSGRGA